MSRAAYSVHQPWSTTPHIICCITADGLLLLACLKWWLRIRFGGKKGSQCMILMVYCSGRADFKPNFPSILESALSVYLPWVPKENPVCDPLTLHRVPLPKYRVAHLGFSPNSNIQSKKNLTTGCQNKNRRQKVTLFQQAVLIRMHRTCVGNRKWMHGSSKGNISSVHLWFLVDAIIGSTDWLRIKKHTGPSNEKNVNMVV